MFGVEVTLASGNDAIPGIKVPGVLFQDRTIYLHEPVCDMWHSVSDMLAERKDVTGFRVVGPVMPLDDAKQLVEVSYRNYLKAHEEQRQLAEQHYKQEIANLAELDKYNQPVSFLNGGVIENSGMAIVGEAGEPELIHVPEGATIQPKEAA